MTASTSIRHLPGLDGLRGIAIVSMMLYHADVSWMGDGARFSIETFFVVSGYLITSLLIAEHGRLGRIDLRRFAVRRARRLYPALIMLLVPVAIYAVTTATPGEIPRMRSDAAAAVSFTSNWSFVFSGQSYSEQATVRSPFLHMWSLAIEVQFYILVAVALALGFRRWGPERRRWGMLAVAGVVLSAGWMALLTRIGELTAAGLWPFGVDPAGVPDHLRSYLNMTGTGDTSRVYFGTDTRLQGLLAGVAIAFFLARFDVGKLSARTVAVGSWVGIGGILAMLFGLSARGVTWIYYGGFAVFDALMVPVVVALVHPRPPLLVRWLSWRPLAFVGVLSYSLYVWHLPIYVFLDETHLQIPIRGAWLVVLKVTVSAAVAYLSLRLVERRIRARGLPTRGWRLSGAAAVLASVAVFAACTAVAMPAGERITDYAVGMETVIGGPIIPGMPVVAIFGDSTAYNLAKGVTEGPALPDPGFQVRATTRFGCGIASDDYVRLGWPVARQPGCQGWRETWPARAAEWQPDVSLILAWVWDLYDLRVSGPDGEVTLVEVGSPAWAEREVDAIQRTIDPLLAEGGVVALVTLPCIDPDADTPESYRTEPDVARRVAAINGVLRDVAARNASRSVQLVDLAGFLCPDGEHHRVRIDGVLVSYDTVHFTPEGAVLTWRWMEPQLRAMAGTG